MLTYVILKCVGILKHNRRTQFAKQQPVLQPINEKNLALLAPSNFLFAAEGTSQNKSDVVAISDTTY